MKRLMLMLVMMMTVCVSAEAQRKCKACGGTGTIVKSISVSRYGLDNDYKMKCPTCGKVYLKSSGHSHISCRMCGGTGYVGDASSGNGGSASERLSELAAANPQAYNAAMTIKYGMKMTDEEYSEICGMDEYNAKQYMKWRDVMNNFVILANQAIRLGRLMGNVQYVDNLKNTSDRQLRELVSTFSVTSGLRVISDKLYSTYNKTYSNYRNLEQQKANLNNLQDRLFQYQLNSLW